MLSNVNSYGMYHCCYTGPLITKCYRPRWSQMFIASPYQPLGYRLRRMTRNHPHWEALTARKLGYNLEVFREWKHRRKGSTIFLSHKTCFSLFLATVTGKRISLHQSGAISWKLRRLTHFHVYVVLDYMCWSHYKNVVHIVFIFHHNCFYQLFGLLPLPSPPVHYVTEVFFLWFV